MDKFSGIGVSLIVLLLFTMLVAERNDMEHTLLAFSVVFVYYIAPIFYLIVLPLSLLIDKVIGENQKHRVLLRLLAHMVLGTSLGILVAIFLLGIQEGINIVKFIFLCLGIAMVYYLSYTWIKNSIIKSIFAFGVPLSLLLMHFLL